MVRERLVDWIDEMTPAGQTYVNLPKRIMYYRDGVSEGQYDQVIEHELSTFGRAYDQVLKEFSKRVNPKKDTRSPDIIAIICGKRHHVRFYPQNEASGDNFGNCHPGTTVDDVVTSPYYQDFYLQSHAGIKGTARPAHYFVIRNGDGTSVEDLRDFVSRKAELN
jgi:eukaryotic translation initiation factor 2C